MMATATAYTTRVLPVEEWPRLDGTDMAGLFPIMPTQDVQIVVVEDGARIVACWAVLRIVHLEGVWIDPAYRQKPSVARRLIAATFAAARTWTTGWVMTGATEDGVRRLITKHLGGVAVPSESYIVPLEGDRVCRYSR